MRILMINKFLYPNGGSETYVFNIGRYLESMGHEVQYFGMDHEGRCVGNRVNAYTTDMNFHGGSRLAKITYPLKTIYSSEARRKIRFVLDDFQPDVCHLNNFNYQLTPSIILEIVKWRKQTKNKCKIIYTAHDGQLVCPNHMLRNPNTKSNCEKCLDGHFIHCIRGRCIHGSMLKSSIGAIEAYFWKKADVYRHIDTVVCCSDFMKKRLSTNPQLKGRLITLHNFFDNSAAERAPGIKKDYVLYFGRYSEEKGIETLLKACRMTPDVRYVFAGKGSLEKEINTLDNVENVGFQKGNALNILIQNALLSVCPSEWYENCPFSVIESQMRGVPVLGADIGGIPELIEVGKTGELFTPGDEEELVNKIKQMLEKNLQYRENCRNVKFDSVEQYCDKLMKYYRGTT